MWSILLESNGSNACLPELSRLSWITIFNWQLQFRMLGMEISCLWIRQICHVHNWHEFPIHTCSTNPDWHQTYQYSRVAYVITSSHPAHSTSIERRKKHLSKSIILFPVDGVHDFMAFTLGRPADIRSTILVSLISSCFLLWRIVIASSPWYVCYNMDDELDLSAKYKFQSRNYS